VQLPTDLPQEPSEASQPQTNSADTLLAPPRCWNSIAGRILRLLLLAVTVCVAWLTIENRWGSNFSLPTRYKHDAHYVLGMIKLAKEGELGLVTHIYTDSLGAPFTGQLNDFPQVERSIIWLGGQIARLTGLMPAANILLIISALIAAFSFYLALRLWKVSRLPSWLFAVTYAFLPHTVRSIEHIGVIFTGFLPLQFYVLWYIATAQSLPWQSWRFRLAIAVSLLSGALGVYWIYFFLQMYALVLLYRFVRRRQNFTRALIPFGATCLIALTFLGSFIIYRISYGGNEVAVNRSYGDVEWWSLKPINLFLPGKFKSFEAISSYLSRYYDGGQISIGEYWGSYIGLCAASGILFLLSGGVFRQIMKRPPSLPYLAVIWIIAYISFGGIHSLVSLILDSYKIRGTNRYSTAIATVGLLYFVFLSHRITRCWPSFFRSLFLILISAFGLLEQSRKSYGFSYGAVPAHEMSHQIAEDKRLASLLESRLDVGSMIYILPVTDFPEPFWGRGAYKGDFHHYQAMRPFLHSTRLRYSYGSNKGRQGADWQLDVQELSAGKMAATLELYGFSGILLNRRGYEDRGEQLLSELAQVGWPMEFEQGIDSEWVFIRLSPAQEPISPTPTPYARTIEN